MTDPIHRPGACLVVGGSGTLGRAIAGALHAEGAQVAATYHEHRAPEGLRGYPLDLRSAAAIEECVAQVATECGGIAALVHCAGLGPAPGQTAADHYLGMEEVDATLWDALLAVNTRSAYLTCRAAARQMDGGNLVLLGSLDGEKAMPTPVHYAASKGALSAMARAMAKELGPRGLRVNVVAPGVLDGGVSRTLPADLEAQYLKHCNLKRRGRIEEVARLVAWLALHNTYVNGETMVVDGGL